LPADVGAVVNICDSEQVDNLELNLVWQLSPRDLGGATEDIKPVLQASPSVLEAWKLVVAQAFSDTNNDLLPSVGTGQVEGSKELGCHHGPCCCVSKRQDYVRGPSHRISNVAGMQELLDKNSRRDVNIPSMNA
jgi:hypothetical protein